MADASVSNKIELIAAFKDLIVDPTIEEKGHICSTFVQMNKGATNMNNIKMVKLNQTQGKFV
jgi:hypothetical protein